MTPTASKRIGICLLICCIHLLVTGASPLFPDAKRSLSPRRVRRSNDVIVPDLLEDELPEDERDEGADYGGTNSRSKRGIDATKLGEDFQEDWVDENGKLILPGRHGMMNFILLTPKKKKVAFCKGYMAAVEYYGNVEVDYGNEHGQSYEQSADDDEYEYEDSFGNTYEFGDFDSFDEHGGPYEYVFEYSTEEETTRPPTTPQATTTTTTTTTEPPSTTTTTTTTSTLPTTSSTTTAGSGSDSEASSSSSDSDSGGSSSSSDSSYVDSEEHYEFNEGEFPGFHPFGNMYGHPGYNPYQQFYYPPPPGYYHGNSYGHHMGIPIPHLKNKKLVQRNSQWHIYDSEKGKVIGKDGRADVDETRQYYRISLKNFCKLLLETEM